MLVAEGWYIRKWLVTFLSGVLLCLAPHPILAAPAQFASLDGNHLPSDSLDQLFLAGNLTDAWTALETADSLSPREWYNLGLLRNALNRDDALDAFEHAWNGAPGIALVGWRYGEALVLAGRYDEAEPVLTAAVDHDPGLYEAVTELGRCQRLAGKPEQALKTLRDAFGSDRTWPEAYVEKARSERALEDWERAAETIEAGIRRFPHACLLREQLRLANQDGSMHEADSIRQQVATLYPALIHRSDRPEPQQPSIAAVSKQDHSHMPLGRTLTYAVRWGLIPIGQLDISVDSVPDPADGGYLVRYVSRSLPGIPAISINDTITARLEPDLSATRELVMRYHEHGHSSVKVIENDPETGMQITRMRASNGYWHMLDRPLPPNLYDASSQLWFARQLVLGEEDGEATVELNGGFERTSIRFVGDDDEMEVDGERLETVRLEGIMRYAGIAGLTGDFKGWFTKDARAWPVRARFKILIGWITLDFKESHPTTDTDRLLVQR